MPVIFKLDVDFLEDEIGLLVTEQSDYYRESTRSAIMSVRGQCQADYSDLCSLPNILATNLKGRSLHSENPLSATDYLFKGGLGYGNPGNACMNKNYENLTPVCRYAVEQVYQTRMNYWQSVTDYGNRRDGGYNGCLIMTLCAYHFVALMVCYQYFCRLSIETARAKRDLAALGVPVASKNGLSVLVRRMIAAYMLFFLLILIAMIIFLTMDPFPSSPAVAFCLVLYIAAIFGGFMVKMSERNKLLQKRLSEARAPIGVAVMPSNVTHDNDNDNDNDGNQGGSDSKNCVPIPCYAETTTATTTTTGTTATAATTAAFRTTQRPTGLIALIATIIGRPSSDRDYAALPALPADNSVHDSYDMVTGVPISAQQKL